MTKKLFIIVAVLFVLWALPKTNTTVVIPTPCVTQDGGESCAHVSLSFKQAQNKVN